MTAWKSRARAHAQANAHIHVHVHVHVHAHVHAHAHARAPKEATPRVTPHFAFPGDLSQTRPDQDDLPKYSTRQILVECTETRCIYDDGHD